MFLLFQPGCFGIFHRWLERRNLGFMAGDACPWDRPVKTYALSLHLLKLGVAEVAGHITVSPHERITGIPVMFKKRRPPALGGVAPQTINRLVGLGKLPAMKVIVTASTVFGSGPEHHIPDAGFKIVGAMAALAGQLGMPSLQAERRAGMTEASQVLPRFQRVAGFATGLGAIGMMRLHVPGELPHVGILVAPGA